MKRHHSHCTLLVKLETCTRPRSMDVWPRFYAGTVTCIYGTSFMFVEYCKSRLLWGKPSSVHKFRLNFLKFIGATHETRNAIINKHRR